MTGLLALRSARTAGVDALRGAQLSMAAKVTAIVTFAALAALGAQVRIYLWDVPITMQTVFVYGSGLVLGARSGFLSMSLYLAL